jgi:hypothetical protein
MLVMAIDVVVVVVLVIWGVPLSSFYIQGGRSYKEGNRGGYNMIPIRTLSTYLFYIYFYRYNYLHHREHTMVL